MEFETPAEEACYQMLVQVIRNHIATHQMTSRQAYVVGVGQLGDLGLQLYANGFDVSAWGTHCAQWLKRRLHDRWEQPAAFTAFAADDAEDDLNSLPLDAPTGMLPPDDVKLGLFNALGQFLSDASVEQSIDLLRGVHVVLAVLTDILVAKFRDQQDDTRAEAEYIIETVVGPSLTHYLTTNIPFTSHRR